jgi:glutamate-ammonia-ligase adenylyltransferase
LDNVARLSGFEDAASWIAHIASASETIARHYDELLDRHGNGADTVPLPARLEQFEPAERKAIEARLEGWRSGKVRALRSEAARDAFDAMLPALIDALAKATDPMRALARWESLIAGLPSAVNMFRLLEARPGLFDQLLRILTLAPPLADELARRPELLDALIDASVLDLPGDLAALAARMEPQSEDVDYETRLDMVRQVVGDTRFALGVQLIDAAQDPLEVGAALCRVAQAALVACAEAATHEFEQAHGRIPDGGLAVLGLGRLGGGMLTHASDLDLVYVFKGDLGAESGGSRPLSATHYFNRLAQRLTGALSVPTAQGALYEVDTRLRPQGNQGPLAVSIDSFERYQKEEAWTWEHMALCRARVLTGPIEARAELEQIIGEVLRRERDPARLKADVLKMRSEMLAHKVPAGPLDAKLLRGGLVDLEFVVHFLQLRERTGFHAGLGEAIAALAGEGLLEKHMVSAHDLMTRILIAARLLAPDGQVPPAPADEALARTCGHEDPDALLQAFGQARKAVAAAWADNFEETLEIDR